MCQTCKTTFCGESCTNVVNKEDMCQGRKCSTCSRDGCPQCIPMISWTSCDDTEPPDYYGQVWKCHNNPDCQ